MNNIEEGAYKAKISFGAYIAGNCKRYIAMLVIGLVCMFGGGLVTFLGGLLAFLAVFGTLYMYFMCKEYFVVTALNEQQIISQLQSNFKSRWHHGSGPGKINMQCELFPLPYEKHSHKVTVSIDIEPLDAQRNVVSFWVSAYSRNDFISPPRGLTKARMTLSSLAKKLDADSAR